MYNKIYLFLLVFISLSVNASALPVEKGKKKTKNENKEIAKQVTEYEKILKGSNVQTANGPSKLHWVGQKVYLELPVNLLGRLWQLTSSLVKTSDSGEGLPGQWSDKYIFLEFRKNGSNLDAHAVLLSQVDNVSGDKNIGKALNDSGLPGIYKTLKIECYNPDSSAIVVNATDFFMEENKYTNPFPKRAGNAIFGLVNRNQSGDRNKSWIEAVKGYDQSVVVRMCKAYSTTSSVMGTSGSSGAVTLVCNRILYLLPENPMPKRLADPRIGTERISFSEIGGGNSVSKKIDYVKRWRIEPSDPEAYRAGKLVEPKKPLVFYLDTLMPEAWRKYVKEGVEAWNPVFEKIGFKNVIRVHDFPRDPDFDATCVENSTIWFTTTWMYTPWQSAITDPRTGEVLSTSIYLPVGMMDALYVYYVTQVMGSTPAARCEYLPEPVMGELIKQLVTFQMGKCLGLTENPAAAHVYPVDSLRSATFTQKYGLAPSIMCGEMEYNYIAQPEDVAKGTRLIPRGPGDYDDYAIRWLYKPIPEAKTPRDEKKILDDWIKEQKSNPWLRYKQATGRDYQCDPTAVASGYGDDHIKALTYWVENMKRSIQCGFDWYRNKRDRVYDIRGRLTNLLSSKYKDQLFNALSYIGGVEMTDVYGDDPTPVFKSVPMKKQEEALKYILSQLNVNMPEYSTAKFEMGEMRNWTEYIRSYALTSLYYRLNFILVGHQQTGSGFDTDKYMQHIFDVVWAPALAGRNLTNQEILNMYYLLGTLSGSSDITLSKYQPRMPGPMGLALHDSPAMFNKASENMDFPAFGNLHYKDDRQANLYLYHELNLKRVDAQAIYFRWLKKSLNLLERVIPNSSGDTRLTYEYFLHRVNSILK